MKKGFFLVYAILASIFVPSYTWAMEPYQGIRWDQEPKLRFELSHEWFLFSDKMLQLDTTQRDSKKHPSRRLGFQTQYRFFEDPAWGKFEGYMDLSLFTGTDAPDRIDFGVELGYTPQSAKTLRLEIGTRAMYNIGEKNPDWGARTYWVGACAKILGGIDFLVDGCGRYHFISDMPASHLTTTEHKNPLTLELGIRGYHRPLDYVDIALASSLYLDKSLEAGRIGFVPSITYYIGKHFYLPDGLSGIALRLSGNVSFLINFDPDNKLDKKYGETRATEIGFGILWEFK